MLPQPEYDFGKMCITDNVLFVVLRSGVHLDFDVAQLILSERILLQKGKRIPAVYDVNGITESNKAGRDEFCKTATILSSGLAFLTNGAVSYDISQLLARKISLNIPCKVFDNSTDTNTFLNTVKHQKF